MHSYFFQYLNNDTKGITFPRLSALNQFIGDLLSTSVLEISQEDSLYLVKKLMAG